MSHIHRDSPPCNKSEVDLFSVPPTQTAIEESQFIVLSPINSVSGITTTPIEFIVSPSAEHFLDLSSANLYLKIKLVNSDGSDLPTDYNVCPESNFLHTFFSQIQLFLNEKKVSSSSTHYAYRAYIEKLINYSITSKRTHLKTSGYIPVAERSEHENDCRSNKSKIFEYYGKLHGDIFQQSNLLLNSVELRLRMLRAPSTFCLNVGLNSISKEPIVTILESELHIRRVKVSTHVYLGIERYLTNHTAKYPLNRVETRSFIVTSGLTFKSLNNIVSGTIPHKVIVGLLPHEAELGDYSLSSLHFIHSDLTRIGLYLNGAPVVKPYELDFTSDNKCYMRAYYDLFNSNGFIGNNSNGITPEEYLKNCTLFSYDLSPDQCSNFFSHVNPIKQGELTLKLQFKKPLPNPITVLFYLEYIDLLEITKSRNILYEV